MKKIFYLENLDCAACAAKMEEAVRKVEGVEDVSVSFMTQKMKLEVLEDRSTEIIQEIQRVCKKIEPDVTLQER